MTTSSPPVSSATSRLRSGGWHMSWSPLITSTGQRTRRHSSAAGVGLGAQRRCAAGSWSASMISAVVPPAHPTRPRAASWSAARAASGRRRSRRSRASRAASSGGSPCSTPRRRRARCRTRRDAVGVPRRQQHARVDRHDAERPGRGGRRRGRATTPAPLADADEPRPARRRRRRGRRARRRAARRRVYAAGSAVRLLPPLPRRVERDDGVPAGEPRHLGLPHPRVDDRVGAEEQQRRLAVAEPLPRDDARRRARRARWRRAAERASGHDQLGDRGRGTGRAAGLDGQVVDRRDRSRRRSPWRGRRGSAASS